MSVRSTALFLASATFLLGGLSSLVFRLWSTPAVPRPTLGVRGLNRSDALHRGGAFAAAEPTMRVLAAWVGALPLERLRRELRRSLVHAGEYLGLSEDELLAMCALCGASAGVAGIFVCRVLALPAPFAAGAFCLGFAGPWLRVMSVAQARARRIGHGLPAAVELAAMCMSAGLDFPGSLRRITDSAADPHDPIVEEFSRVLQELDLGHTRKTAMEGFAFRVPIDAVREFVNSVVQAEAKGSPLAKVLTIQSQTQRLRRSVAAEEAATGAALMLLGPMTLIFLCVIVLLLGPVLIRFMMGGLAPG